MSNKFFNYLSSLNGRITLMFVILAFLIEVSIALYWVFFLRPHIESDIESDIKALAQTQSYSIADILSGNEINRDRIIKTIDELFLLRDPVSEIPFVSGIELSIDYDVVDVPVGSLNISRWQEEKDSIKKDDYYNIEIPLLSNTTKELIGIAQFHGSRESFKRFENQVRKNFIAAIIGTMLLLLVCWQVLLFLLKPLQLLTESLNSNHIKDIKPPGYSGKMVSSEIRLVDMKLKELFKKINDYTMELETLNTILATQQETSLDGVIIVDRKGRILNYNRRFVSMWDLSDEIMNTGSGEYALEMAKIKMSDPEVLFSQIRYFYDNPADRTFRELNLVNGGVFECYSSPMTGRDGSFFGRVWYFRDISARRRAEISLWESEEKYRLFLQNFVGIAYQADKQSLEFNLIHGYVKDISGYSDSEILDKKITLRALIHPEDQKRALKDIAKLRTNSESVADNDYRIIRKDRTIKWIRNICRVIKPGTGQPSFIQGAFYDITRSKQLESQLHQARKMESIGTMAGGIAHDFNNILGIILGNAELTKLCLQDGEPVDGYIEEIRIACMRAKNMVAQILAFSRKNDQEFIPLDINSLIEECVKLIRVSIPSSISISLDLSKTNETISGDRTQISQVMLNLCANSAHAMRESGGTLNIEVKNADNSDKSFSDDCRLNGDKYVEIKVSDTGHGINPVILERIFDPYFTTKDVGEGSGMGLAVVHGIISGHRGRIYVDSEEGTGTTFRILLPVINTRPDDEEESSGHYCRGTERILLADDEKEIVMILGNLFKKLGYSVTSGTDPVEILGKFRENPAGFDLLITDMTMPKMTGFELAKKMKDIRPEIPVILCTGYSEIIDEHMALEAGISRFIMKPITLNDVADTVRTVLDDGC